MRPLPPRVLVLGMGRSGEAVLRYLAAERDGGADVTAELLDEGSGPDIERRAEALAKETGFPVGTGASYVRGEWDLVVASPGIPPKSALMRAAAGTGAPLVSELEFAWTRARSPFVAVTGTNGKTTTTALIAHLLGDAGVAAKAVGNIGEPTIAAVRDAGPATVLVAEVSSFQLALTFEFKPRVAVLLNITPDHVDWHGSLERYEADKAKVFANMGPGDVAVIDVDDPGSAPWAERVEAAGVRVVRVTLAGPVPGGAWLEGGTLMVDGARGPEALCAVDELRIRGRHNVSNALAGAAAAIAAGAGTGAVRQGLLSFAPIEHRLEPVGTAEGVEFYNDSKATNPDAVLKALTAFDERPVLILLGGRNKGNDFTELARAVGARCKTAVLFGEARGDLAAAFAACGIPALTAEHLSDALAMAVAEALPGDVVLLSPACASFDEFRSYEHRGAVFKDLVNALSGATAGDSR